MSFFDPQSTVAKPGFNRWLVPPAALAIHLSIGQVYAFSVFKIPLTQVIGITKPAEGDWSQSQIAIIFSIAIFVLGCSAALFGKWLEKNGPRKAMLISACCFGGGFLVAALGVSIHSLWLLYLGYGVLGGIGLGLAYISPVATLMRWFPDRTGMATGLAIMGFGGGAMIGGALAIRLMKHYATAASNGVVPALVTMGIVYFLFMLFGVFTIRTPAPGWKPAGYVAPTGAKKMISTHDVSVDSAFKTPQFYLVWIVLCFNATAGIGILEQASPMIQEMLLVPKGVANAAVVAGGFVGLLSLFNMAGRIGWSSVSDLIGRKQVFFIYLLLGPLLYLLIPMAAHAGSIPFFVALTCVILSMYGAGFSTTPAYLRDLFGTAQVGAIYGRILTAWSAAGIFGPMLVNGIREHQIAQGAVGADRYTPTMYLMVGLLLVGAVCNALIRPVDAKYHMDKKPTP